MTEFMKQGLFRSIALHGLILLLLAGGAQKAAESGQGNSKTPKEEHSHILDAGKKTLQIEITPAPEPKKAEDKNGLLKVNNEKVVEKSDAGFVDRDCGSGPWFGGIGIKIGVIRDTEQLLVLEVHNGYPAKKMGLMIGDEITNYGEIRGMPGTQVTVHIVRNGQKMDLIGTREKICTAD